MSALPQCQSADYRPTSLFSEGHPVNKSDLLTPSMTPQIAAHFDKAARSYRSAATLQHQVAADLAALLPAHCNVLLDVGCGPGWNHQQLLAHCSELWALDLSAAMLAQAQQAGFASRFLQADVCQIPLADCSVDVIFSSLMLQWCRNPTAAFCELYRVLKPGGTLLVSTLVQGSFHEFQQSWAQVDEHPHQLEFLPASALLNTLQQLEMKVDSLQRQYQLHYSDVWALARSFKQIGANFVQGRQGQGLTGKQRWLAFSRSYEQFRDAQGLPLSYQVLQLQVTRPAAIAAKPAALSDKS